MKTIKLSNPPYWWVLASMGAYALAIAYLPMAYLWWITEGAPMAPMVPPPIAYIGGYKDAVPHLLIIAVLSVGVWFGLSFARKALYTGARSFKKWRASRMPYRTQPQAVEPTALAKVDVSAPSKRFEDPYSLSKRWLEACCAKRKDAKTNMHAVRASFAKWCEKNNEVQPSNSQWLAGMLRAHGYAVEVMPKEKNEPKGYGNRYVRGLALK